MIAIKRISLWLVFILTCFLSASALTPTVPENRVWEIFSTGDGAVTTEAIIGYDSPVRITSTYDGASNQHAGGENRSIEATYTLFGPNAEFKAAETTMPRFTQSTTSAFFKNGEFAGQSIADVATGLRSGAISPSQLPLQVITREGNLLSLNTRSLLALRRAGADTSEFVLQDLNGDAAAEQLLTERLLRNGLDNAGTDVLRITGAGPNASLLNP